MNKLHFSRLEKLTTHLETGKLAHKKWNYGVWNMGHIEYKDHCGTNGCAAGEMPAIFRHWHWAGGSGPYYSLKPNLMTGVAAAGFFGISYNEYRHLFLPKAQRVEFAGSNFLGKGARRKTVAAHFRKFLESKR